MPYFIDQCNKKIWITDNLKRIISLVPSQTELLFDLGLNEEVIGITKFCIHPTSWLREKAQIGGTKNINIEKIQSLQPDLVIANKEENVKEQIEMIEKFCPVWTSDVHNVTTAIEMIQSIGMITQKQAEADTMIATLKDNFSKNKPNFPLLNACYLIWKDPYITVGGDTFINDMMHWCGLKNVFENDTRYPQILLKEIINLNCEVLLLSSEPYPFKEHHITLLQEELPTIKIFLVDGEMFSWYGSRLLKTPTYFKQLNNLLHA